MFRSVLLPARGPFRIDALGDNRNVNEALHGNSAADPVSDGWSRLQPPLEAAPGTEVLLVRHGETEWNLLRRIQGQIDVDLSPRGELQARLLGQHLRGAAPDLVVSSDLTRARRTAELACDALDGCRIELDIDIRELVLGAFEGRLVSELAAEFPDEYQAWRRDALRHRPPGGEQLHELQGRCRRALQRWLPEVKGGRLLLVSHGGPIRALTLCLLGLPLAFYPRLRVDNAGITRILFHSDGPVLAAYNQTAHLAGDRAGIDTFQEQ